jgi:hypothetical protein
MKIKKPILIKKNIRFYVLLIVIVSIVSLSYLVVFGYAQNCYQDTQFNIDKKEIMKENPKISENDLYYLKENFDSYGKVYSLSIDTIDDLQGFTIVGSAKNLEVSNENYGTEKSVAFTISPSIKGDSYVVIRKNLEEPLNLSMWDSFGYFSIWLKIENRIGISGVSLKIRDNSGNYRIFKELPNLQINDPDFVKINDIYPDLYFPENGTASNKWEDFRLVEGWNFLFWRADSSYWTDSNKVNMSEISWYEIIFNLTDNFSEQTLNIDNLRVEDGLQKIKNPTNGNWYSPNGAPQYGIFDVDETYNGSGDYMLRLLNVKQTQYPSNGDHTRILSNMTTPKNFTMEIYFKLIDLPPKYGGGVFNYTINRKNTWFRVQYDFDNVYDPGHDWFGFFISLETDKIGLATVYPVTRYFEQAQEPINFDDSNRKSFSPKENVLYVLDIKALGQYEKATLYEVNGNCFTKVAEVEYTFKRQRYDNIRYPFSIETTGNVHADIYSIEVMKI